MLLPPNALDASFSQQLLRSKDRPRIRAFDVNLQQIDPVQLGKSVVQSHDSYLPRPL
jgi:hypothetical protein